jgi:PadR family transcriptional regulator PadR
MVSLTGILGQTGQDKPLPPPPPSPPTRASPPPPPQARPPAKKDGVKFMLKVHTGKGKEGREETEETEDAGEKDPKFEKDLLTGLISLVLLSITASANEPLYGYQIAKEMESGKGVELKQGTIYPVLRALEKNGLLKSQIKASEAGPPRKYYLITPKGREKLALWTRSWEATRDFVDGILGGVGDE